MADIDTLMPPAQVQPMDDEETLRRKLITNAGGMSAMPAASRGPSSANSGGQDMPPAQTAPTQRSRSFLVPSGMPPAGAAKAEPEPVGAPTMPAANVGPQQKRYNDLSAQGAPELHGWKKVLNAIGSVSPLGRSIESAIPGSPENYNEALNSAAVRAAKEQGITGTGLAQKKEQQEIQDEPDKTALNKRNIESEITARGDKDSQALAAHGLKRDETGAVVADEESPVYKQSQQKLLDHEKTDANLNEYRQAGTELRQAQTDFEKTKSDPNSPQNKAAAARLATAQKNADTAAGRLGFEHQKFNAQYEGLGPNGKPLAGVSTDEKGNPIGPSVANASNTSADRLKRSDLARNVETNINSFKDLIKTNPNLFGKIAGRYTTVEQMIGSDDPAIARAGVMVHNAALASNGAHGVRSAEAVTQTENELLNHFHNGPEATMAAADEMVKSVQTFRDDANHGKRANNSAAGGNDLGAAPKGKAEGATGKLHDGTKVVVKNGRLVAQ